MNTEYEAKPGDILVSFAPVLGGSYDGRGRTRLSAVDFKPGGLGVKVNKWFAERKGVGSPEFTLRDGKQLVSIERGGKRIWSLFGGWEVMELCTNRK